MALIIVISNEGKREQTRLRTEPSGQKHTQSQVVGQSRVHGVEARAQPTADSDKKKG